MEERKGDTPKYDDYDSPWKEAIEQYLPEFLELFFPNVAHEIEWEKGYEFLDKELQKVVREATSQERSVDKLVKVWRKPADEESEDSASKKKGQKSKKEKKSKEAWVFIHIDVQSQYETNFGQRLYIYNYRLFDRYLQPIATLVVLGDDKSWWHPKEYSHELWGCRLKLEFPTVKLLEYQQPEKWAELEQSNNPFAVVVMAHIHTKNTKHKPNERFELKWRLTRMLYERGYSKPDVLSLFRFIDWMMALPPELEEQLKEQMIAYEEEQKVPYITNIERMGIKKGIQQGIPQGRLEKVRQNITTVIQSRFGNVHPTLIESINGIDQEAALDMLFQHSLEVESVPTFQQKLAEVKRTLN